MGATNCPETPRQKMIGMMYLVLTAMLALNVSKEIINAFVTVGDAMAQTNVNFSKKINDSYIMFEQAYKGSPEKVEENYKKAKQLRELSQNMVGFIDSISYDFISQVESKIKVGDEKAMPSTPELAKQLILERGIDGIEKKDEYSVGSKYFCGNANGGVGGMATELKSRMENYKSELRKILGEDSNSINLGLETNGDYRELGNPKKVLTWEYYNFHNTITVANLVILNRIKAEVMNAEFDVVNRLYHLVSAEDFKFSSVTAKVIPKSKYVLEGNLFEAEAIVAAYDEKASMDAVIGGGARISSKDGVVPIRFTANGLGKKTLKGTLYVKTEGGEVPYAFEEDYFVIPPTAVVSLTKMDVFYVGLDNPVSISVPMVDAKNISPRFAETGKGTISPDPESKTPGDYVIKVGSKGTVTLQVYTTIDGKQQLAGSRKYKCKDIPVPTLLFGNVVGGGIVTKEQLLAAGGFRVQIPDFDFAIPPLRADSYVFGSTSTRNNEVVDHMGSGNRFTTEMIDLIRKARSGQRISIMDVRVVTPDGKKHTLGANLIIR